MASPASPFGAAAARLFLVSFLALFVELLLIRWIPSALHVVAFFNNLVLIACFLGLGVGMARPQPLQEAAWRATFRLLVLVALIAVVGFINPTIQRSGDLDLNEMIVNPTLKVPLPLVLLAVFALVAWTLLPFGEMVAVCFDELDRIPAYTVNILGSLFGVLAFALCSWLEQPPYIWFIVLGLGLMVADCSPRLAVPLGMILAALLLQQFQTTAGGKISIFWSPYYKVLARPLQDSDPKRGFILDVNDQFLLSGLDLRAEQPYTADRMAAQLNELTGGKKSEKELLELAATQLADLAMLKSYYEFPFTLKPPRRVLILGSGAGNDVAVALRFGAEAVTAVEIDPRVLALGQKWHPEQPYASPKVEIILNDARVFLNHTKEKFDLIIFATLDAHGLLSSVGNVRLDSFIYTRESLALAKEHLAPDGLLILSFGPFAEATQYRQFATVRSVFGTTPLYFEHRNQHRTLVAGALDQITTQLPEVALSHAADQEWRQIGAAEIDGKLREYPHAETPATDNWPHLYLKQPALPGEYLWVLGGVLAFGVALVLWRFRGQARLDGHFFFLGAGFLLMETKSVTEFALLMGSTWQVNVLVFSVILVMILIANLLILTLLKNLPVLPCYLLLFAGLLLGYFYPPTSWAEGGAMLYLGAGFYLGVPIFLAGLIFAATFKHVPLGSAALASNIVGAVLGGCAEYLSLAWGLRSLSLLALGMYAASLLCWKLQQWQRARNRQPAASADSPASTATA